jgi:small GTP-binding protein
MTSIVSYKFIIIGSSGVGKTAILKRLVEDSFTDESQSTIGVEFDSTVMTVEDRKVKLQIWDTAGQERFRSIAKAYYRNAVGVILVFDITDRKSFDDLSSWLNDVHTLCDPNAVIQLIGNKTDLHGRRVVTLTEAENFASNHRMQYLETSAKVGENVRDAFQRVATSIMTRGLRPSNPPIDKSPLLSDKGGGKNKGSCC